MPPSKPVRPLVVARSISLASGLRRKLAHFAAPPLQIEPAALGFDLDSGCAAAQGRLQYTTNGGRIVLRFDDIFVERAVLLDRQSPLFRLPCGENIFKCLEKQKEIVIIGLGWIRLCKSEVCQCEYTPDENKSEPQIEDGPLVP